MLISTVCLLALSFGQREARAATIYAAADGSQPVVVPILFPLENRVKWEDTFGAPRSGGRTHAGNDLMVPKMTPLLAVVDGTVDWLNLTGKLSSDNGLPYYNILLHGDDGNDYFYVHVNNDTPGTDDGKGGVQYAYAPGLTNGKRVQKGEVIGYAGDSGNAEDVGSQLHFEIHLGGYKSATGSETRSPSAIDPYASLMAAPTLSEWQAAGGAGSTTTTTEFGPGDTSPTSITTTTARPTTTTTVKRTTTTTTTTTVKRTTTTTTTTTSPAPAGSGVSGYTDVHKSDWFYEDFAQARAAGVVAPSADERFRPYSKVSRALFTVYLVRAMVPAELAGLSSTGGSHEAGTFSDVDTDYWAYPEVEIAARLHLVQGTGDGSTFSPDTLVTRAQMAAMMCRAIEAQVSPSLAKASASANKFADVPKDYWAQEPIAAMESLGLMCGDDAGRFHPLEKSTRAQAITVIARLMRLLEGGSGS